MEEEGDEVVGEEEGGVEVGGDEGVFRAEFGGYYFENCVEAFWGSGQPVAS